MGFPLKAFLFTEDLVLINGTKWFGINEEEMEKERQNKTWRGGIDSDSKSRGAIILLLKIEQYLVLGLSG